jgi:hypothetical protein
MFYGLLKIVNGELSMEYLGPEVIGDGLAGTRAAIYWLGRLANRVDHYLETVPQPDAQTPDWDALDPEGRELFAVDLDHVLDLERSFTEALLGEPFRASVLPGHLEAKLRFKISNYRGLLPFAKGELNWLDGIYNGIVEGKPRDRLAPLATALRTERGSFTVTGRHQPLSGAELTDRWWAWQRGVDEFADVGTRDSARAELQDIRTLMGDAWVDGDWTLKLEG